MSTDTRTTTTQADQHQRRPVYELLAMDVKRLGVECVFGLMSDDTVEFAVTLDAIGVPFIGARHENNAITMAEGYAAATGGLGIAVVGRGPATANGLHASVYALRTGSRVLIIYGDAAIGAGAANGIGPDYKEFDASGVLAAAGLPVFRPTSALAARVTLRDAVAAVRRGTAAALLLPVDIQQVEIVDDEHATRAEPAPVPSYSPASDQSINIAWDLLSRSRKPLIVAGRGAYRAGAREALEGLSERIGAVLATSARAKEMFDGHPYNLGIVGSFSTAVARRHIEQADCVIVFGASLNCFTSSFGMSLPSVPLIQVDTARANIGRYLNADVAIVGDATHVAERLCAALGDAPSDTAEVGFHNPQAKAQIASFDMHDEFQPAHTAHTLDPRSLGLALDEILPRKRNLVFDAGHFLGVVPYLKVPGPDHFKFTSDFASIGMGFGTALGFARARPDHTTVLVIGDGGFMMTISELETVVREDMPIVIVVMNDCAYGAELHVLRPRQLPTEKSIFPDIDFADIAACFGFETATIRSLDDLAAAAPLLSNPQGPVLIDCKINQDVVAPFMSELVDAIHSD
jgi:acetolactate synthase I/II/III large subunit